MDEVVAKFKEAFDISDVGFMRLCIEAPRKYKVFTIPKRGSPERRLVAQPARELKTVQRWFVCHLLDRLPIHSAATAYRKGASILQNAQLHQKSPYLLKFDFKDFFPSITPSDLTSRVGKYDLGITSYEMELVARLFFWGGRRKEGLELCIGAPSSPVISNVVMFEFDTTVSEFCKSYDLRYSRYADDVCISGADKDAVLEAGMFYQKLVLDAKSPDLLINPNKTRFINDKSPKRITGLNITPSGTISAGRDLKRRVRSLAHHYKLGSLSSADVQVLFGYLNYLHDVEPVYAASILSRINERNG